MSHKAVLFDLDNTLYDYESNNQRALKATYKLLRRYIRISEKRFLDLYQASRREVQMELAGTASAHNRVIYFQRLVEKTHKTVDPRIILKLDEVYWDNLLKKMEPFDGVKKFLQDLKKWGYKTAIVSDQTTKVQLRKLHALGLSRWIDVLVTSEEVGSNKPNPIMYLMALNKLGVVKGDVWMVGDNPVRDIEGANALGIETIQVLHGKHGRVRKEDYRRPDHAIRKFEHIRKIIEPE